MQQRAPDKGTYLMSVQINRLSSRLNEIEKRLLQCKNDLYNLSQTIESTHEIPSLATMVPISELNEEFDSLIEESEQLANKLEIDFERTRSVEKLRTWLRLAFSTDQVKSQRLFEASRILNLIAGLHHRDRHAVRGLAECNASATVLLSKLETGDFDGEIEEIIEGKHVLWFLAYLVENASSVSEAEIENAFEIVNDGFGAQLALAASRGALKVVDNFTHDQPPVLPQTIKLDEAPSNVLTDERPSVDDVVGEELRMHQSSEYLVAPSSNQENYTQPFLTLDSFLSVSALENNSQPRNLDLPERRAGSFSLLKQFDVKRSLAKQPCPHCNKNHRSVCLARTPFPKFEAAEGELTGEVTENPSEIVLQDSLSLDDRSELDIGNLSSIDEGSPEAQADESRIGPGSVSNGQDVSFEHSLPSMADLHSLSTVLSQSNSSNDCENLAIYLIGRSDLSLALQVATYFELMHPDKTLENLPTWLLRTLVLGMAVQGEQDTSDIARILANEIGLTEHSQHFAPHEIFKNVANLLKVAACLRPSLLAPSTCAYEILKSVRLEGLPKLTQYVQAISEFGARRWALDPHTFAFLKSKADLDNDIRELEREADNWFLKAPQAEMIYGGTKKVWLQWLKPNELLSDILEPVRTSDMSSVERVKDLVAKANDAGEIERQAHRIERIISTSARDKTTGKALIKLHAGVAQAVEIASRWVRLCGIRAALNNEFSRGQAERIRSELAKLHDPVLSELSLTDDSTNNWAIRAAVNIVQIAVRDIRDLFNTTAPSLLQEIQVLQLEREDLLLVTGLRLNQAWDIVSPHDSNSIYRTIIDYLQTSDPDLLISCEARMKVGDHVSVAHILQLLRRDGLVSEADRLTQINEQRIREAKIRLQKDIESTRIFIEDAVGVALLRETERAEFISVVFGIEQSLESTLSFPDHHERLSLIKEQISKRREVAIDQVRSRLEGLTISANDRDRIVQVLDTGDFLTANEYLARIATEQALPEPIFARNTFAEFFPVTAMELEKYLADSRVKEKVIRQVKERENFCGINLKKPSQMQIQRAAKMLEYWFKARDDKQIKEDSLRAILSLLGFAVKSVARADFVYNRYWFDVITDPIRTKENCPIAKFGSAAEGHYRILCVFGRPTDEDLLNEVKETVQGPPVIVFYFGSFSTRHRRSIARLSRERRRTFIVVDDILMVYLAGDDHLRLSTMFQCTLPFTFAEPYVTTPGLVPPEMFYGRRSERDSIINPMGSCFIYGGRQLGKTVLLRQVERDFHRPANQQIAIWIDIKDVRAADDLTAILANELSQKSPIKIPVMQPIKLEQLLDSIKLWLSEEPTRRLLVLLDEADRFLELDAKLEDGEGFRRTGRLKNLMDATHRQFKVLFAGLHNVQRTTRLSNHPLAHYGEPICVGPLLNGDDWREARELIKAPLRAIGYEIADDLVTRIMSQTNYYPSLIQLYCQELLRHVLQKQNLAKFSYNDVPSFTLTDEFVRDAYLSQNLRKEIRSRFILTLLLDRRYEVIAYAIAHGTITGDWKSAEFGYPVDWIHDELMTWWPAGFRNTSRDELRALLDEMVGLGILRQTDHNRFALRSPNVVLLMGTEDEIVDTLLAEREPEMEYEPNTYRVALPKSNAKSNLVKLSPLTAQQQADLADRKQSVYVIAGSDAGGMEDIPTSIRIEFTHFHEIPSSLDRVSFGNYLKDGKCGIKNADALFLVPKGAPWTMDWIRDAVSFCEKAQPGNSFPKICFIADPKRVWQLGNDVSLEELREKCQVLSLRSWDDSALRYWFEESQYSGIDKKQRESVSTFTSNWPKFLYQLASDKSGSLSWEERIELFAEDLNAGRDRYRAWFGIDELDPIVISVLTNLSILGNSSEEELAQLEEQSKTQIKTVLQWAELLHWCTQSERDLWQINPMVAKLL